MESLLKPGQIKIEVLNLILFDCEDNEYIGLKHKVNSCKITTFETVSILVIWIIVTVVLFKFCRYEVLLWIWNVRR